MRGDQCLLEGIERGEKNFGELVQRYYRPLLLLCTRIMGDKYRAEDIVQESFIKSYRSLHTLNKYGSFKSWLYRIAINTARNELRLKSEQSVEIDEKYLNPTSGADVDLAHQRVADLLSDLIQALPTKQKQALCLRIYDDLSFKEIALVMGCPYDTAKANYRHAVLRIKECLAVSSLSAEDLSFNCKWGGAPFFKTGAGR